MDSVLDAGAVLPYATGVSRTAKIQETAKAESLPFEEALKRLEKIVEALESEDLPLETLISRYEEGNRLAQMCQTKLAEAETKIQKLEKSSAGEMVLKPLAPDPTEPQA